MGESWSEPVGLINKDGKSLVSDYARIAAMPDGSIIANIIRCYRVDYCWLQHGQTMKGMAKIFLTSTL